MDNVEESTGTCQVSLGTGESLLHLVSFTNGIVNQDSDNGLKVEVYKTGGKSNVDMEITKKVLLFESERMQYTSEGFEFRSSVRTSFSRYQIGVVNRRKQQMKLYNVCMMDCKPVLELPSLDQTQMDKSYVEKVDSLTNAFGSKRKKKAVQSRLKNVIDEDEMGSVLSNAVKQSDTSQVIVEPAETAASESLPPKNPAALIPEDVYELHDIITEEEYFALEDETKNLKETLDEINLYEADSKYCHFVARYLKQNYQRLDAHKMKLLLYFNYLVMLLKLGYKELRQKDLLLEVPEPIKRKLLSKFVITSQEEGGRQLRSFPPKMKDKVMAYCVILALLIENFKTDLNILLRDFKVGVMKLTKIAYALGCHISKKKCDGIAVNTIELKIPLYVPNDRSWKRKGKS